MRAYFLMLASLLVSVVSLSCTVDFGTTPTVQVASLSVEPTSATIQVGTSTQLSAMARDSSGGTLSGRLTTWTSSDHRIASLGAPGVIKGVAPGSAEIIATAEGKSDTAAITVTSDPVPPTPPVPPVPPAPPAPPALTQLVLTPASITLAPGGTSQFAVAGTWSDSSTTVPAVTYSATGGTITSGAFYTAGSVAGSYRVIVTQTGGTLADTSLVTITPASPILEAVVLTPASIELQTGATQQFAASGRMSDGSTTTVNVTYSETGGAITSGGFYTAGGVAGSYRVIATQTGGTLADTSTVTVITPPPPPSSCLRTVNASTLSGFTSALAGALPGDCIFLAPGTYTLTSGLAINRSGTAAQPILIQGGGMSNTVIDVNQTSVNIDASYIKLRKIRFTDFGLSGLWFHGSTYNIIDSVEIDHTQQWALALKDGSHHNVIKNSRFHDTGMGSHPEWGEGIYISNSGDPGYPLDFTCTDNQILNNHFGPNVRSISVILSEGADRTTVKGNVFDGTGGVDVPGFRGLIVSFANDGLFDGNTMQFGRPDGITFFAPQTRTMAGNVVSNNFVDLQNMFGYAPGTYWGFQMTQNTDSPSRVTVKCSNTVINGPFSNVACTP